MHRQLERSAVGRAVEVHVVLVRQCRKVYALDPLMFSDVGTYNVDDRLIVALRLPIRLWIIGIREHAINPEEEAQRVE